LLSAQKNKNKIPQAETGARLFLKNFQIKMDCQNQLEPAAKMGSK